MSSTTAAAVLDLVQLQDNTATYFSDASVVPVTAQVVGVQVESRLLIDGQCSDEALCSIQSSLLERQGEEGLPCDVVAADNGVRRVTFTLPLEADDKRMSVELRCVSDESLNGRRLLQDSSPASITYNLLLQDGAAEEVNQELAGLVSDTQRYGTYSKTLVTLSVQLTTGSGQAVDMSTEVISAYEEAVTPAIEENGFGLSAVEVEDNNSNSNNNRKENDDGAAPDANVNEAGGGSLAIIAAGAAGGVVGVLIVFLVVRRMRRHARSHFGQEEIQLGKFGRSDSLNPEENDRLTDNDGEEFYHAKGYPQHQRPEADDDVSETRRSLLPYDDSSLVKVAVMLHPDTEESAKTGAAIRSLAGSNSALTRTFSIEIEDMQNSPIKSPRAGI